MKRIQRRTAMQSMAAAVAASQIPLHASVGQETETQQPVSAVQGEFEAPVFIATWNFGIRACKQSLETLASTNSCLDAVEQGIRLTESEEPNRSVGYGGHPNANGVVQLDACFMDGKTQKAGSVGALSGYPHPISVARRVMEQTKHVMLVGDDAADFAKQQGFTGKNMLSEGAKAAFERWKKEQASQAPAEDEPALNHDTIALLGLADGHLVGGCSTSGLAYKTPGRVGDSPIIGSGMYVDGEVGAAGATGIGENIMRYCGSFLIVEKMREGMTPTEACVYTIKRIAAGEKRPLANLGVNFIAINKQGQVGAAGTEKGFRLAVAAKNRAVIVVPEWVH